MVFIGGTGTGKTHLATALGVSGITRHGKRVRFNSTVDLVNLLDQEKAAGKAGKLAFALMRMDLVILDELVLNARRQLPLAGMAAPCRAATAPYRFFRPGFPLRAAQGKIIITLFALRAMDSAP